ncbi:phosphate regulon sensor histidine kinase PhoR [Oxalobacter vibrioformis]|uniref:Phosphate regulon sensor protein PhoR n=1 Tax=Oxalobacter vibrioformis TaxID=933080 RepID=A0A9E9LY46_9BURK|nr:phosphate regulon sensor histidine kinase PhoR [Oxalobacter vibrioformis]WAW09592.1 phosphate regulon sensor histidine kinase PhoR [Oxalobacter vibrioformis]
MNPHVMFWIPAALRLALTWIVAGVLWYYYGPVIGLLAGFVLMTAMVFVQLYFLSRLDIWLDNPNSAESPGGWGAWAAIYDRLMQLQRDEEKSQAELTEWLVRFRQAMALLPIGVVIADDVMFLEWCNPAAEKHLGLSETEDRGMRITNLVRNPEFINYLVLGRYDKPLPMTLNDRRLVLQVIPFENRRQIFVTYDTTEQENIAKMRRDFVANASHELRTPLTVINGFLEVAEAQPDMDKDTRTAHLQLMREQGERMQRLVDSMLQLTALESPDNPVVREAVNMYELIQGVCDEANMVSNGRHDISLDMADGPETMYGSEDEIRTALWNLVRNAVRYTPPGGKVALKWENTEKGPHFVVTDTGIGIAAEHIPRLTQRFYLVDKTRSRKERGSGLGLAIVRHALMRHKGELQVKSQVGVGSEFTAQFPNSALVP